MGHHRGLAVHEPFSPDDLAAECLADGLVPQAHAKERQPGLGGSTYQRHRDARLVGRAGTGGNDDGGGAKRDEVVHGGGIVPVHHRFGAQLAGVLDEVVGETVVVIEDEKHSPS